MPAAIESMLELDGAMASIAAAHARADRALVVARGYEYATAREWAIKIKELAHVFADPYSAADFQHGPVALVEPGVPVIVVVRDGPAAAGLIALLGRLREDFDADVTVLSDVPAALAVATRAVSLPSVPARVAGADRDRRRRPAARVPPDPRARARPGRAAEHHQGDPHALIAPGAAPRVRDPGRSATRWSRPGRSATRSVPTPVGPRLGSTFMDRTLWPIQPHRGRRPGSGCPFRARVMPSERPGRRIRAPNGQRTGHCVLLVSVVAGRTVSPTRTLLEARPRRNIQIGVAVEPVHAVPFGDLVKRRRAPA